MIYHYVREVVQEGRLCLFKVNTLHKAGMMTKVLSSERFVYLYSLFKARSWLTVFFFFKKKFIIMSFAELDFCFFISC